MESVTFKVGGMTCMGCVGSVQNVLRGTPGVSRVDVSLAEARATVEFDPARVQVETLRRAVEDAGFDAAG